MRDGKDGGGGPFPYYPTTGDAIRDAASDVQAPASDLDTARRQLEAGHRRALAAVEGELYAPLTQAPETATADLAHLQQAAGVRGRGGAAVRRCRR